MSQPPDTMTEDDAKRAKVKKAPEVEEEKKGPGRPRKKPLKPPMKKNGVSATPLYKDNCMEMVYDSPTVFKKIFTLFKAMAIKEICISFEEKVINILTTDHLKKSHIKVPIKCDNINHYYCKEPIKSYIHPKNMEKIIQVLDKNYTSIAFELKSVTNRSVLSIIYKNDMKVDEYRDIDLIQPSDNITDVSFDDTTYPIKFTLPSKYFKKTVNDISTFSDILTLNKMGGTPLTFTYASKDKTVKSKHAFKDPSVIKLVSTIADDDIFSSSVRIDYVKPLSGTLIAEYIHISADQNRNMIFKIDADGANIQILISTSTVHLR